MACDPASLLEQAKCITTCISPGMLPAVNTALLCQIVDAGGGGGGGAGGIVNVAEQVVGSGTNYTLTNAFANVVFGTTSPVVVLPATGTYLILANAVYVADAAGAADIVQFRLRNTTDAATIGSAGPVIVSGVAGGFVSAAFNGIVSIVGAKTVTIQAANGAAARGSVISTNTAISYVRLY